MDLAGSERTKKTGVSGGLGKIVIAEKKVRTRIGIPKSACNEGPKRRECQVGPRAGIRDVRTRRHASLASRAAPHVHTLSSLLPARSRPAGQTLKEAQFINRSLSFLEQTVNALSRKDAYVPYRQTKLTAVLRDALGGNCKTVMVANVWGEYGTYFAHDYELF